MNSAPSRDGEARAERVAARAVALGVGLIVFMVTWLLASRIAGALLPVPIGPIIALSLAIAAGAIVTIRQSRRLAPKTT